ncbi:hypothetical protein DM01DRAFT_1346376 [Hesseltinella vesiculosa]|uniref:Uncharacterized protein n=1 Tax=Hesseltinella vesiculosa TaxID=101127 RepID=A0A1X2GFL1_9FUNG|nr:hypothetical protein DM01DRAFT_1346376 [Hesseltinella vesiculosa]
MATSTDPADRSQSLKSDLTNTMARLQGVLHPSMPSMPAFQQYLVALKHDLALFVSLSKEWSSIHATQPLSLMFPDWPLLEEYIYELMRYTMIHDHLIQPRPVLTRTGDLYEDLQSLQQFLEDQCVLHGIHLVNQGQQWQDMGLPVDQDCLHQAKQYFFSTCRDMVESVYNALTCDGYTEKMMDCIVLAFECLATTHELIGDSLALELLQLCLPWLAIYGQWSVQQMEMVTPRSRAHRSDMRISQLLDYMTRILNSCHRLFQPSTTYTLDPVPTVSFATSLVDMTFLVVTALGQHSSSQHQNYIKRSNIMRSSPFAVFYLEKSLFDFASSAIALYSLMKESNKLYEQKMMSLLHVMQEDQ